VSDTSEKLLVRDTEAAKMLDMGRSTFWKAVSDGLLPQPVKIGGLTRWRVADLRRHIEASSTTTS
jgi:predicted DNA-binding transcriptional regulator AlpA